MNYWISKRRLLDGTKDVVIQLKKFSVLFSFGEVSPKLCESIHREYIKFDILIAVRC